MSKRNSLGNRETNSLKGTPPNPKTTSKKISVSRGASPANLQKGLLHNSKPTTKTSNEKKAGSSQPSSVSSKALTGKTKAKEPEPGTSGQEKKTAAPSGSKPQGQTKAPNRSSRALSKKLAVTPLRMHTTVPGLDANKKAAGAPPEGMIGCKVCGRNFTSERIDQHQQICKQSHSKSRKVFDSRRQRTQGTDLEPYVRRGTYKNVVQAPKNRWREKHEEFIRSIRYAKQTQAHVAAGGKATDLPPPPPSDYSDYIQCPYCKRKFSPEVAERHIPKCKNIISNKK